MLKAIPYYRVSTDRQGRSGLGLEAQQRSVQDFAAVSRLELLGSFTEIESGSYNRRPILRQALQRCRQEGATLLIAKLDRLARDVAFVSSLMKSRVKFIAVDFPDANDLMLHIMAAFAEHERRQISVRTKEAMASAKLRGITFGSYGKLVLSGQNRTNADLFALSLVPTIDRLNEMGLCTVRSIAEELNRERILTYRKGTHKWHLQTVHHLLKRIETLKSKT